MENVENDARKKGTFMLKPNLFRDFATSELSQDAFLCWLISWANPDLKNLNPVIANVAIELLNSFFKKRGIDPPGQYEKVIVERQKYEIDILVEINSKYSILIEDKIETKEHSEQLVRYVTSIMQHGINEENIIPIYLKIVEQGNYENVVKSGFEVYTRKELIGVLSNGICKENSNDIYIDYFEYINEVNKEIESYTKLAIDKWVWRSWIGFYSKLQETIRDANWDYVPNPSGGFLGFWWHFNYTDEVEWYLQLEMGKLCFKISVDNANKRNELRQLWCDKIVAKSKEFGMNIGKPPRFGLGQYMTVAVLNHEYRKVNEMGIINMEETIRLLQTAEALMDSFIV